MVDERLEDTGSSPDSSRPKRTPPTIDLEATEVSSEPRAEAGPEPELEPEPAPGTATADTVNEPSTAEPGPRPISPWVIAPFSGAVAAALVIGVGWLLGWPAVPPAAVQPLAPAAPQVNAAAIDDLSTRVAGLETKTSKPPAPATDPALTARVDATEKSINSLRGEVAAIRTSTEKLAAAVNEVKAMPRDGSAPPPDLSGINDRIAQLESKMRAQSAAIGQFDGKLAETKAQEAKAADDTPLRRLVAASLLDTAVRHGDPYVAPLEAARSFAENADALKPLDTFAKSGIPGPNVLCRELLEIVPKLAPKPEAAPASVGAGTPRPAAGGRNEAGPHRAHRWRRQ